MPPYDESFVHREPSKTGKSWYNTRPRSDKLPEPHIADLHITRPRDTNYLDFLSIVAQLETACKDQLDFVVLPGDNADQGRPEQYRLAATAGRHSISVGTPAYRLPRRTKNGSDADSIGTVILRPFKVPKQPSQLRCP